jgi:hypothetical protein
MFPQFSPQLQSNVQESTESPGKSFLFDFETGDFAVLDGKVKVVEGYAALKVWIEKGMRTEKFKFKIYETGVEDEYGITMLDFINGDYPEVFKKAELQREITRFLLTHPEIISIDNMVFIRDRRAMIIDFDINTIYGTIQQEVKL